MRWVAKAIATVGGVGFCPIAPGTMGSVVGLVVGLGASALQPLWIQWGVLALGFLLGVVASTLAEQAMAIHDPPAVVIDECWAVWAILVVMPHVRQALWLLVLAFGLFRLFDIAKPPPLKQLARCPGGWGIMLDDLGAVVYTCLVLSIVLKMIG